VIYRRLCVWLCCLCAALNCAWAVDYRIALLDYKHATVWRELVNALQAADPGDRFTIVGEYPAKRLVELGKNGQYDVCFPDAEGRDGKVLFGFEHVSSFVFYETDIVLVSKLGEPALDDKGVPTGEIESIAGTQSVIPFKVTENNQTESSLRKLLAGRIVGLVVGRPTIVPMLKAFNADKVVELKSIRSGTVRAGFTQQTGWQEKAQHLDTLLEKLRQSGTLEKILAPVTGNAGNQEAATAR
jgi:hypothetical protein